MKRIFWFVLGATIVWFISRQKMDTLYGEISRLRESQRRHESAS